MRGWDRTAGCHGRSATVRIAPAAIPAPSAPFDAPASGGLTNQLMVVSVTTYSDDNGNSTMDSTEMQTTLTTKIAKSVNYATKASS